MDEYKVKITPQASAQMLELFSYISNTLGYLSLEKTVQVQTVLYRFLI